MRYQISLTLRYEDEDGNELVVRKTFIRVKPYDAMQACKEFIESLNAVKITQEVSIGKWVN